MKALTYVEIDVDRCANVYGITPCAAVIQASNDTAEYWDFDQNSINDFTVVHGTFVAGVGGATLTETANDMNLLSPSLQTIDGSVYQIIVIDWERISADATFDGSVFYTTGGHSFSGSFFNSFTDIAVGPSHRQRTIIDMASLVVGGTDWVMSIITQLRFDFGEAGTGAIKIHSIRVAARGSGFKCYNSLKTCQDRLHLTPQTETIRFSLASEHYPDDQIDAIPNITGISFSPGTISLGEDLGQRATLTVTFLDHPHSDTGPGGDRYLSSRGFDPYKKGSFWGKFRARFPFLQGRPIRIYRGVVGQTLAEMDVRYYIIDSFDGPNPQGVFTIAAKDVLKLADDTTSQCPSLSQGFLSADMLITDTSFTINPVGAGALYASGGFINIGGSEIVGYTRSGDVFTIIRAQFNTAAATHSAQDLVQFCQAYEAVSPALILADLLVNHANIPIAFVDQDAWEAECDTYLQSVYTTLIPTPTGVNTLAAEIIQQAALAVWWDDSAQKIRLQVLRQIPADATVLNEDNINQASLQTAEQPDQRLTQVWTYYALINPLVDLTQTSNYRSVELAVSEQLESDYGVPVIKQIFSRWIPQFGRSIATKLNNLILGRYQNAPRQFTFMTYGQSSSFLKLGNGYNIQFRTLVDEQGDLVTIPMQITRLNPDVDKYQIEAQEALFAKTGNFNNRIIVIDTSTNNFNLRAVHDSLFPPIIDPTGITITCIIQPGVVVGNDQTLVGLAGRGVAFDVGVFPTGTDITINLQGDIRAGGGKGGNATGSSGSPVAQDGQIGGTGLKTTIPIKLTVLIAGPTVAGGGGGGGGWFTPAIHNNAAGGGGGAGQIGGAGGFSLVSGAGNSPGSPGTLLAGGHGDQALGGGPGLPGQTPTGGTALGNGGLAGRSVDGIANITITDLAPSFIGPAV